MHKYVTLSLLILVLLSFQFLPPGNTASSQTLVNAKWVLYEVKLNPSGVLSDYSYDRRVTINGLDQGAKGFVNTAVNTGALSYQEWVEDLKGTVLWSQDFSYDFTPPPAEMVTGDRFEISVRGQGICKKADANVSGVVKFISGFYVKRGLADSEGNFLNRPSETYLEVGDRTSYSESKVVPVPVPAAKLPVSEQSWRIEVTSTSEYKNEKGDKGPLLVAWIYRAVESSETAPTTTTSSAVTTTSASVVPEKDPGQDALDILGRIGREVARERIQKEVRTSIEEIQEWLADTWESYGGWVDELLEDPWSWIDGPLLDKFGEDFGAEEGEPVPGLTMEEINEQLFDRIKPVAGLNEESMDELLERVQHILWEEDPATGRFQPRRTTTFDTVDMKMNDGGTVKIGILVTPEGRIMYTPNGQDYYPDLQRIFDPSYREQAGDLISGMKDWAWDSLFTGSTRNPDTDLQNAVAFEVLEDLRVQLNAGETPETIGDWIEGKLWTSQVQDPLETKMRQTLWTQAGKALETFLSAEDITVEASNTYLTSFRDLKHQFEGGELTTPKAWAEFKSQTGIDLFELTEAAQYSVMGGEFAIECVKTMARELQDTDFAVRTRAYIEERNAGYAIDLIYERMREGQLPELDIGSGKAVSGGTSSLMASSGVDAQAQTGIMFTMYEQAYQRYLLAQKMGRQP